MILKLNLKDLFPHHPYHLQNGTVLDDRGYEAFVDVDLLEDVSTFKWLPFFGPNKAQSLCVAAGDVDWSFLLRLGDLRSLLERDANPRIENLTALALMMHRLGHEGVYEYLVTYLKHQDKPLIIWDDESREDLKTYLPPALFNALTFEVYEIPF